MQGNDSSFSAVPDADGPEFLEVPTAFLLK